MTALAALKQRLAASGADFELLAELPPDAGMARLRCIGPFAGELIVWEARIMTLAHWQAGEPTTPDAAPRQFIEIFSPVAGVRHVDIALAVPIIDIPVITKALIMLRQYKRLAEGRHEFGPSWSEAAGKPPA